MDIRYLLRKYDLKPSKGLAQNYLVDDNALKNIIRAADLPDHTTVLEIGPGLGSLTQLLAVNADKVIAVELDRHLIPPLQEVLKDHENIEIIQGDILEVDLNQIIKQSGYYVVANIPYYITSAILRRLMEADHKPKRIVLTIQQEVGKRIIAKPGQYSLLALSIQVYGHPQLVEKIPAAAFYPPPKVDSAVICIDTFEEPRIPVDRLPLFFKLIKAGFSQKRKTLRNALAAGLGIMTTESEEILSKAGIDPQRRAQTLSIEEWNEITKSFYAVQCEFLQESI